jgi:hypothetical protein
MVADIALARRIGRQPLKATDTHEPADAVVMARKVAYTTSRQSTDAGTFTAKQSGENRCPMPK